MKLKTEINRDSLVSLYYENRDFVLPIFAIIVSVFLFIIFIIPQVLSFPARKSEVDIEETKLNKIKESEKMLSTVSVDLINSQVEIASKTLPDKKSFEEVLSAISSAANLSNSQIESYQFQDSNIAPTTPQSFQFLKFQVSIFGDVNQAVDFINELYETYPISNVVGIKNSESLSTISIVFFYNPFISQTLEDRTAVRDMSSKEKATLSDITKWKDPSENVFEQIPGATESAKTSSSPF